ncbi:MAG: TerB family tellurite resistance protein [Alphaproteobacteria bacterium]|nr:TerB family tellurite resistance protein [Alphaproteobacteria bacterium]
MAVVQDTLDLSGTHVSSVLSPGDPAADAILHLLAHMAFSDGVLHDGELGFLASILPGRTPDALRRWVREVGSEPPLLEEVAEAIQDSDMRWTCLRFTARMAWKDGELQDEERQFLETLADTLGLPRFAVDRVLREMEPGSERFTTDRIIQVMKSVKWNAVKIASGPIASADLAAVAPPGDPCVCRIGLDKVEVMGIYQTGLSSRFLEGPCFLAWSEIVSYARGLGLGSAVRLVTEGGVAYNLVDSRLTGLCMVLDLLLGGDERPKGEAPKVELVIGE